MLFEHKYFRDHVGVVHETTGAMGPHSSMRCEWREFRLNGRDLVAADPPVTCIECLAVVPKG